MQYRLRNQTGEREAMNIDFSNRKKLTMEEMERLIDPTKRPFSRPYEDYTWRDLLALWSPDINTKPN
jgi:hypothetical protein